MEYAIVLLDNFRWVLYDFIPNYTSIFGKALCFVGLFVFLFLLYLLISYIVKYITKTNYKSSFTNSIYDDLIDYMYSIFIYL